MMPSLPSSSAPLQAASLSTEGAPVEPDFDPQPTRLLKTLLVLGLMLVGTLGGWVFALRTPPLYRVEMTLPQGGPEQGDIFSRSREQVLQSHPQPEAPKEWIEQLRRSVGLRAAPDPLEALESPSTLMRIEPGPGQLSTMILHCQSTSAQTAALLCAAAAKLLTSPELPNDEKMDSVADTWLGQQMFEKVQQSQQLQHLGNLTSPPPGRSSLGATQEARLSALASALAEAYTDRVTSQIAALRSAQSAAEAAAILLPLVESKLTPVDGLPAEDPIARSHRERLIDLAYQSQSRRVPKRFVEATTLGLLGKEIDSLRALRQQVAAHAPAKQPVPPNVGPRRLVAGPLIEASVAGGLLGGVVGLALATLVRPRRVSAKPEESHHPLATVPDARELTSAYLPYRAVAEGSPVQSSFRPSPIPPKDVKGLVRWNGRFAAIGVQFLRSIAISPEPIQVVLVSSCRARSGCTTVAASLAHALAASGKRILVVDANLNAPKLHTFFAMKNADGLSELLESSASLTEAPLEFLFRRTSVPNLAVVPAGQPHASSVALLSSDRFPLLLKRLSASFDLIFVDAPPLASIREIGSLAAVSHALLLVIAPSEATTPSVAAALRDVHIPWVEMIENHIEQYDGDSLV